METTGTRLRILIHAPTAGAVERARNNALNLKKDAPEAEVRIIANVQGAAAVLDMPRADIDSLTLVCGNTLARTQRSHLHRLKLCRRQLPSRSCSATAAVICVPELAPVSGCNGQ